MLRVLNSLSQQHDWRLVGLAGFVCCLSGIVAINLYRRARAAKDLQSVWLVIAGVTTGGGVWATHFVAMLAYQPGLKTAYDPPPTVLSLVAAAIVMTIGFWIALRWRSRLAAPVGGGVLGIGVAAMHYLGMTAIEIQADIRWSAPLVAASLALGVLLGAASLTIAQREGRRATLAAAAALSLATLSLHFIAMGSITLVPDPQRAIETFAFDPITLALAIAGAAIAVLSTGLVAAYYEQRLSARAAQYERAQKELTRQSEEQLRVQNLHLLAALNNMSQALSMFDAERKLIVCNENYARMFALPARLTTPGTPVSDILDHRVSTGLFRDGPAYKRARLQVVSDDAPSKHLLELDDGRVLCVLHHPMADGGWVATHEDITEQVLAQRELQRVHATLEEAKAGAERAAARAQAAHQQLLEASNLMQAGLVLFDAEDRHVLWNRRYAETFGAAAAKIAVGMTFEDALRASQAGQTYPNGTEPDRWRAERLARHRLPVNTQEMSLPGDKWLRIDERRTADGGSIGVRVDITELKRREESQRMLFASNPLPMWVYDKQTLRFLSVNEAALAHYGYAAKKFLAMTLADIWPAAPPVPADAGGSSQNGLIARHLKADGQEIDVAIYMRPLEHEGRAAALMAAVDITQSKRAEAEVLHTREFFNTIVENVPAPIIVKSARDFRHILVNRAAESFLGAPRASVIGKTASELYSREAAAIIDERDLSTLRDRRESFIAEHRLETPGAGSRYVTSTQLPVFDDKGEPLYVLTVLNDVTERRIANERIAHLSSHDALTGLVNRAAFADRLSEALARNHQQGVATLCVDLDRFKEINDIFGHSAADRVLKAVAERLSAAAGDRVLARVGGDEFNLIVSDGEQPAAAVEVADRLLAALAEEIEIEEGRLKASLSIGVAIAPADGADAPTLIANAEAALYRAKNEGRGVTRFFEADMDKRLRERRALEHDLKSALALGQLRIHYQPQANVAGELVGFEALVRWLHPTRGAVPPSVFIPIAEESGMIATLGEWILRQACREAASWPRPLGVSVNLSPVQFRQHDLFTLIRMTLTETGLPGNRLELEITEGVLIGDSAAALGALRRIKALGVRIAMDDFGTGYSSLSYLQSFPFDKIKIDRSFVANVDRNPHSAAIIRAVLGLAHGLHLPVIAEGVETEEQLAFLEREGCDEVQGYLFGRPRPIEEYAAWIACESAGPRLFKIVA